MNREKLIEEAVLAMYEASFGYTPDALEPDAREEWEALARAAFNVFENAQHHGRSLKEMLAEPEGQVTVETHGPSGLISTVRVQISKCAHDFGWHGDGKTLNCLVCNTSFPASELEGGAHER